MTTAGEGGMVDTKIEKICGRKFGLLKIMVNLGNAISKQQQPTPDFRWLHESFRH